jgi:formyltetrahydrofolate deformylase
MTDAHLVDGADATLIVTGKDQPGLVAAVSSLLRDAGANIFTLDQYSTDASGGRFFQRTQFFLAGFGAARPALEAELDTLAKRFDLEWKLTDQSIPKRVAIFASKSDHCLLDLLWRQRRGELPVTISMVIANHAELADEVRFFGVPFFHTPTSGEDRAAVESDQLKLIQGNVDFVVLARYMQILTPDFISGAGVPIINIHHSFLPAFVGAAPYRKAKERGVKLIGATAHYVTPELDEGPIIEQDVVRVSHDDTVEQLTRRGADVERQVLARAVLWHAQDRVIRDGNQTIVF